MPTRPSFSRGISPPLEPSSRTIDTFHFPMPATPPDFGVTNLYGMSVPSGGYCEEITEEASLDTVIARNQVGEIVLAEPRRLITKNITMTGRGAADLAAVVSVNNVSLGDVLIVSAKNMETNTDMPTFEISARSYSNRT